MLEYELTQRPDQNLHGTRNARSVKVKLLRVRLCTGVQHYAGSAAICRMPKCAFCFSDLGYFKKSRECSRCYLSFCSQCLPASKKSCSRCIKNVDRADDGGDNTPRQLVSLEQRTKEMCRSAEQKYRPDPRDEDLYRRYRELASYNQIQSHGVNPSKYLGTTTDHSSIPPTVKEARTSGRSMPVVSSGSDQNDGQLERRIAQLHDLEFVPMSIPEPGSVAFTMSKVYQEMGLDELARLQGCGKIIDKVNSKHEEDQLADDSKGSLCCYMCGKNAEFTCSGCEDDFCGKCLKIIHAGLDEDDIGEHMVTKHMQGV